MKIDCTIDGKILTLSLNSNKPLSLILQENLDNETITTHCNGKQCGLCAVLINGKAELSCMVPAFELKGKNIVTFESFQKTKDMKDIAKAYELLGIEPCKDCYGARSIIYSSIIASGETMPDDIKRMMLGVKCPCLEPSDDVAIINKILEIRRKRNVRRS